MSKIKFDIPVQISIDFLNKNKNDSLIMPKVCNYIENYFNFSKECYIYKGEKSILGKKVVQLSVKEIEESQTVKTIKILSYFTLVIPIVMLFAKIIYRFYMDFQTPWINKNGDINFKLNHLAFNKKPTPIPIPQNHEEPLETIISLAESLNIEDITWVKEAGKDKAIKGPSDLMGLKYLVQDIKSNPHSPVQQYTEKYLKAISKSLLNTDLDIKSKKEAIININKDCGINACPPGRLTKVQKEYSKLLGADENSVEEIFLREIQDYKLEILNQMAREALYQPGNTAGLWEIHYIAAAQVFLGDFLGLDKEAGKRDPNYNSHTVKKFFTGLQKFKTIARFKELYKAKGLFEWLEGKINGNQDSYGVTLHIQDYYYFIKNRLQKFGFIKPASPGQLRKGPLKVYIQNALTILDESELNESNLEKVYDTAMEEMLNEHFFFFNEDCCCVTRLKPQAIIFILHEMNIFH